MGFLGLGEPSIGTFVIIFGAWLNRDKTFNPPLRSWLRWRTGNDDTLDALDLEKLNRALPPEIHSSSPPRSSPWRHRDINFLSYTVTVATPSTYHLSDTLPSRVLRKFPYIIEIVYWGLIYSVYQMARGFLAVHRHSRVVDVARTHALQVIWLERQLGIFVEQPIQAWFLQYSTLMYWINRTYSFLHLPATITFLVGFYWYTITCNRPLASLTGVASGPWLYESRRRTLALSNLLSFIVFSVWPCMPPRLLDKKSAVYEVGPAAALTEFGFVDTVHQHKGPVSVFNQKKWTNQLAAMPSMHFGYALLIGISMATLPLTSRTAPRGRLRLRSPVSLLSRRTRSFRLPWPGWTRIMLVIVGVTYPVLILTVIVSTANHFILDAIAGGLVVGIAWKLNGLMLNLRIIEDCIFWLLRTHKPVSGEEIDGAAATEGGEERLASRSNHRRVVTA